MSLKDYQSEVLDRYEAFLHAWRAQAEANPGTRQASRLAFEQCTQANFGFRIPYHAPEALAADDVPVVCLRVPTGGGKTWLAATSPGFSGSALSGLSTPLNLAQGGAPVDR